MSQHLRFALLVYLLVLNPFHKVESATVSAVACEMLDPVLPSGMNQAFLNAHNADLFTALQTEEDSNDPAVKIIPCLRIGEYSGLADEPIDNGQFVFSFHFRYFGIDLPPPYFGCYC